MSQKNRPIDRLKLFIAFKRLSDSAFEKAVPLSNGYISKLDKGTGDIGSGILAKIYEVFPDLNLIWILTGVGTMEHSPASIKSGGELYKKPENPVGKPSDVKKEGLYRKIIQEEGFDGVLVHLLSGMDEIRELLEKQQKKRN